MNQLWGYLIVEELVRNGIDYFVISPGSRSTPLTVAAAQHPLAKKIICPDERGAAFHAIGYARATGIPAVLICTSGTAAANYLPAAIEATMDKLPLIILSGDRPPELRQTGANQTINQVDLYGNYVEWQFDLPCPSDEINPQVVLTTIDLVCAKARGGVVHLNCMFREPLAPKDDLPVELPASLARWQNSRAPYTRYARTLTIPESSEIELLVDMIGASNRGGILYLGWLRSPRETNAAIRLAERLNWAVIADIQSGLRLQRDFANLIHYGDRLLLADSLPERLRQRLASVETIVQLGTRIVSAQWGKWLERHPPTNYIVVTDDGDRHDPQHLVTHRIESDLTYLCDRLCQSLPQLPLTDWVQKLRADSDLLDRKIANFLKTSTLTEPGIARTISALIPSEHGLWVANSMPIRDLEMYGIGAIDRELNSSPRIGANRATSGIEGAIAAASGFAVGMDAPVTAIVGDLSSLHDLNSLALLSRISQPVILIIINNDGGGIFSFLPISKSSKIFEDYFGTPHGLNFSQAAAMFGLKYYHPPDLDRLITDYQQALTEDCSAIIEVITDRTDNFHVHQQLIQLG